MENYEALLATLALAMGASWASGINLYAALLVLSFGGYTGNIDLPPDLMVLADPMVIGAAGIMYFIEFFTDKTPGVDTSWDAIHTFIRIPAGAMLAAGAVGDVTPALEITAGLLGGGIAATSHAAKAGTRMLINTSPEPVTNWTASISEDILVIAGLWTALNYPLAFIILFFTFICLAIWLLPKLWVLIKVILLKIGKFLGLVKSDPAVMDDFTQSEAGIQKEGNNLTALKQLQQLRARGAITEAEFMDQKQKIIEKIDS